MSTSNPRPADAVRVRPDTPDDPTIWEVDDALWARLAPLLVNDKPRKKPGRPRRNDRMLVNGLIWLARTGAQCVALPARYGPKSTLHARFQEWVQPGVYTACLLSCGPCCWRRTTTWSASTGSGKPPMVVWSRCPSGKGC